MLFELDKNVIIGLATAIPPLFGIFYFVPINILNQRLGIIIDKELLKPFLYVQIIFALISLLILYVVNYYSISILLNKFYLVEHNYKTILFALIIILTFFSYYIKKICRIKCIFIISYIFYLFYYFSFNFKGYLYLSDVISNIFIPLIILWSLTLILFFKKEINDAFRNKYVDIFIEFCCKNICRLWILLLIAAIINLLCIKMLNNGLYLSHIMSFIIIGYLDLLSFICIIFNFSYQALINHLTLLNINKKYYLEICHDNKEAIPVVYCEKNRVILLKTMKENIENEKSIVSIHHKNCKIIIK